MSVKALKKKQIFDFVFVFCCTILTLLFFSYESPLCKNNFWVDVTSHMIVGRALNHGLTLYRDIYDTKGPSLFIVAQIANLISDDNFVGFWIFEVLAVCSYAWFSLKSLRLTRRDESVSVIYAILALLVYVSCLYQAHTFTVELLMLGIFAYVIYIYTKVVSDCHVYCFEYILCGLLVAFVFWAKFNYVALFFALYVVLIVYFIRREDVKAAINSSLCIICGFLILTFYIFWKYGFSLLMNDYFRILFSYADSGKRSLMVNVLSVVSYFFSSFLSAFLCIISVLYEKNKDMKRLYVVLYVCQTLMLFVYFNTIRYYFVPYIITGLSGVYWLFHDVVLRMSVWKRRFFVGFLGLYLFAAAFNEANVDMIDFDTENCIQYRMAEYIEQNDLEKTMLYDYSGPDDMSVMNMVKSIPNVKYFATYAYLPVQTEAHADAIKNKEVSYIITGTDKNVYPGYHLVMSDRIVNCYGTSVLASEYLWEVDR